MPPTANPSLRARGMGNAAADRSGSSAERMLARFMPRRGPIAGDHRLAMRNVYVLPSRTGLVFAGMLLTMLVCSINYRLALGYALTFLVTGIACVGLMHTFRNLSALTLRPGRGESVFAGQMAEVGFMVLNRSRLERFAIRIDTDAGSQTETVDVAPAAEQLVRIALPTRRRGLMAMPRITLSTRYPLGLWRAWAYWQPAQHLIVYPTPESHAPPLPASLDALGEGTGGSGLEEDLAAVRPYQPGDTPRRIAWTAIARSGSDDLLTKQFEGGATGELLLDFSQLPATLDTEGRLSRLARWVIDAESGGHRYALHLPGRTIEAAHGAAHRTECLEALALYGSGGKSAHTPPAKPAPRRARWIRKERA